ncbi:MAG: hypothetical protein KC586_27505, partial [Myxococcales bacterium]|nr:hypothetical protein [Myxococcales bacterium]
GAPTKASAAEPAKRPKPKGFDFMVMLAIGFVMAELGVRLIGLEPTVYPPHRMLETADKRHGLECYSEPVASGLDVVDLRDMGVFASAVEHGFSEEQLYGAIDGGVPHCVTFVYNAQTRRDVEFRIDPRVRSVLVLGDSFTEGAGVPEDEVFPRLLERTLQRELRATERAGALAQLEAPAVKVWNAGRRGADQPDLAESTTRFVELTNPELVVYAFVLNDFEQTEAYAAQQEYLNDLVMDRQRTGNPSWKLPAWLRWSAFVRAFAARRRMAEESERTLAWYRGMTGSDNAEGWERTQRDLRAMRDAVEGDGRRRFLVAILPLLVGTGDAYPFHELHEELLRFCEEASIRCVDLRDAFDGVDPSTLHVHPVDMHPNGRAHERIARALESPVLELLEAR